MVTDNHFRWDFVGLSTDQKPTPTTSPKVVDGSTFYCSDNSKLYVWCKTQWYERKPLGGGGGGGTDDFEDLENRPKYNGSEMTGETDIPQLQFSTMPTASADWDGKIIQYVGETQAGSYTQGFFYKCTTLMPGVYTWLQVKSSPDPTLPVAFLEYGSAGAYMTVLIGLSNINKTMYFVYYQNVMYRFTSASNGGNTFNFSAIVDDTSYNIALTSAGWGEPTTTSLLTLATLPTYDGGVS